MRSALSISLPGARRPARPAGAAGGRGGRVLVPVIMAAQKPVATTLSITIETAGIVVRAECGVDVGWLAAGEGRLMIVRRGRCASWWRRGRSTFARAWMASPRWCVRAWAAIPYSGVIYVFRAKRADRVKLWLWDGTGLVLVAKRLESFPGIGGKPAQGTPNREFGFAQRGDKTTGRPILIRNISRPEELGSVYTLQRKR